MDDNHPEGSVMMTIALSMLAVPTATEPRVMPLKVCLVFEEDATIVPKHGCCSGLELANSDVAGVRFRFNRH